MKLIIRPYQYGEKLSSIILIEKVIFNIGIIIKILVLILIIIISVRNKSYCGVPNKWSHRVCLWVRY